MPPQRGERKLAGGEQSEPPGRRGTTIRTPAGVAGTPRASAGAHSFIAISPEVRSTGSEGEFQPELNLPRCRDRRGDAAGSGVDDTGLLEDDPVRGVGNRKVRVVKEVEDLGPELNSFLFLEAELLREGEVDIH